MAVRFERAPNFLRIILEGEMTIEDMYAGVDEIYVADVPQMVLWDMMEATVPDVEDAAGQLRNFSEYATERGKNRADGRVALLVPTELQYGLARMSTSFAQVNQAAYNMIPFRNESEAITFATGCKKFLKRRGG